MCDLHELRVRMNLYARTWTSERAVYVLAVDKAARACRVPCRMKAVQRMDLYWAWLALANGALLAHEALEAEPLRGHW